MRMWDANEGALLRATVPVLLFSLLFAGALLSGCAEADRPPREAEVRALIERAEGLAEDRNLEEFRELISEEYSDSRGNNRESVLLVLNYYMSANRSIHLLTRVPQINFVDSTHADLLVFVAMAGRPITATDQLSGMNADLYHVFTSVVEEDDGWKISAARWARGWEAELDGGTATNPLDRR